MDSTGDVIRRRGARQMRGDAHGLHCRTLLRRRSVPWHDIAEVRVHLRYLRGQPWRQVDVLLRDGHRRRLPLPWSQTWDDPDFDATVKALRTLHHRHGGPQASSACDPSGPVPVITDRTAGWGWAGSLALCAVLLVGAGVAALFVPHAASQKRAWQTAVPCAAGAPGRECLLTDQAVIEWTDPNGYRQRSWLYFTDSRPLERLSVDENAARAFQAGDRVEVTIWRGEVREVSGARHLWREHFPGGGEVAVVSAALALAAGWPASRLLLRLRGRRLPDDEVLPSAVPYAAVLIGTALWLLPLCYLHPLTVFSDPTALAWATAGSLTTLLLSTWAWRATRIHPPNPAPTPPTGPAFLAARFLEPTDYNPHHFGTHIALGDGPPAVTPHPGPGRFAARPIPAARLTLKQIRRVRGADGDTVPRNWHIAELDDAGEPVRLAAAPADLTRILNELGLTRRKETNPSA